MKKKIGIFTITDNNNYGNRLQNYALYKQLTNMGFDVFNFENYPYFNNNNLIKYILKKIKYFNYSKGYSIITDKAKNYQEFNNLINWYPKVYSPLSKYKFLDYAICGSDQVWNPHFALSDCLILKNFPNNKRISYAASFGVEEIPQNKIPLLKNELPNFKAISVREDAGKLIIKKTTGLDSLVVIDPTMLLDADDWRKVSKKPQNASTDFILTYFLSPMNENAKKQIRELGEDVQVYNLLDDNDQVVGTAGPSEFLWLFDNARLILTDSFHACVFSFIFNKPFIVYDRNMDGASMNSRINTLLTKFKLNRKYNGSSLQNDIWEHDYTEGYKILENEKIRAIKFLENSLDE